ncbi:MAG TPA: hypothetical protein VM098_05430, partial [Phycisphaerae bacterium]|nr:hypothetical protein [Phycisphaerae bacterium]
MCGKSLHDSQGEANTGPGRFESLAAAMDGPRSAFFGLGQERPRNPESYYSRLDTANLTFDISNNQILCSFTAGGLAEHACVLERVAAGCADERFVGAYVTKHVIGGGPWPFAIELGGKEPKSLHELKRVSVDLLGGLFPLFEHEAGPIRVRQLAFAPLDAGNVPNSPRAFIMVFEISNRGDAPASGALTAPAGGAHKGIVPLDDSRGRTTAARAKFSLPAGERSVFVYAIALGASAEELNAAIEAIRQRTVLQWLNDTWRYHAERAGSLSIPADEFYAEGLLRMGELCRQTIIRLPGGQFGGGSWGSRFTGTGSWEARIIWIKDIYHAMLPMGMLEPQLCAAAALWFLRFGTPPAAFGPGLHRFSNLRGVNHSLVNSMAAFQLAGEYYRATGDAEFFGRHGEFLAKAKESFDDLLASRQGEAMLFPSLYISDGPARGDFHTGSNVVVWDAMSKMARLAREVYARDDLADKWAADASKLREEILARCVAACPPGRRFVEGANADGTKVPGHDGEETDTTLMPFYAFCQQDDQRLINHAAMAFTEDNPLYWPEMDGVWWTDDQRFGATFPAWMTAIAGACDEAKLAGQLMRIRRLTD